MMQVVSLTVRNTHLTAKLASVASPKNAIVLLVRSEMKKVDLITMEQGIMLHGWRAGSAPTALEQSMVFLSTAMRAIIHFAWSTQQAWRLHLHPLTILFKVAKT